MLKLNTIAREADKKRFRELVKEATKRGNILADLDYLTPWVDAKEIVSVSSEPVCEVVCYNYSFPYGETKKVYHEFKLSLKENVAN